LLFGLNFELLKPINFILRMKSKEKNYRNNLRKALTEVCDYALVEFPGFQWISHDANYKNFPDNLLVTCVFDSKDALEVLKNSGHQIVLRNQIQESLLKWDVAIKHSKEQVKFSVPPP